MAVVTGAMVNAVRKSATPTSTCVGGYCVTPAGPDGSACQTNGNCSSGYCHNGLCETPSGGGKPVGSTCSSGAECQSQVCIGGFCTSPIN